MRDTKATIAARHAEPDPYRRRFPFPKWNGLITVTHEHKLFRRLPEFADWTADRHFNMAIEFLNLAQVTTAMYADCLKLAIDMYGDRPGPLISGIYSAHFPEPIKDTLRTLAHTSSESADRSLAHWRASRRTIATWRAACATKPATANERNTQ